MTETPAPDYPEHVTDGCDCWCNPRLMSVTDDEGDVVVIAIHTAADWRFLNCVTERPYLHGAN